MRPTFALALALLATLACSNVLPPLPELPGDLAEQNAPDAAPTAIYATGGGNPPFTLTVEVATALTARTGPGERFTVVSPMNGEDPYFLSGEQVWLVNDDQPNCQPDGLGNLWIHVGSDRGIVGWAAGYYEGEFLLYPIPPNCGG